MTTIILMYAVVMCDGDSLVKHQIIQTTPKAFTHDLQLVRMGWWDHVNDRRCKALKVRYETVQE